MARGAGAATVRDLPSVPGVPGVPAAVGDMPGVPGVPATVGDMAGVPAAAGNPGAAGVGLGIPAGSPWAASNSDTSLASQFTDVEP